MNNKRHRFERFAALSFLSVLVAGGLLAATSGIAAAARLFDAATQADLRAAAQVQSTQAGDPRDRLVRRSVPGALRDRVVRVNAAELARIVPSGADNAANRLERARNLTGAVTLELFPGVSVTARRTDIEAPDEGGYVWAGEDAGARHAFVTLVIHNGDIVGQIQTGGKLYRIEPVSGPVHRIIEIDEAKIRDDLHPPRPPRKAIQDKSGAAEPAPEADPKAKTTIKVLVANTLNARGEMTGSSPAAKRQKMQQRINLAIALANQAYTRSGVKIRFVRVGGENEVNYNDVSSYGAGTVNNYLGSLCDLSGPDTAASCTDVGNNQTAKFNAVRAKRNAANADLVALMRKGGVYCGIGWEPDLSGTVTPADHPYGFSVTTSSPSSACIEGHTFAHETGHNQGLNHDRVQHKLDYSVPTPPASQFNFGHVNKAKKFSTIMAYRTGCPGGCTRIPYFSTPLKKFPNNASGVPVGVAQGTGGLYGAADAVRRLNANRSIVADYR